MTKNQKKLKFNQFHLMQVSLKVNTLKNFQNIKKYDKKYSNLINKEIIKIKFIIVV